jgi:outer membrane lipoprotein-sorting protein
MHRSVITILSCLLCVLVQAQYPGYKAVANTDAFKKSFAQSSQKTNTLKSDFVQEKTLSMLSEKIVSKGKFYFKKENAVRMEYTSPFQYLMVINGNNVYIKDNQKENKMSASSNKLFQSINRIMMDCVKGTVFDNKDFSVKLFESNDSYLAELTPLNKDLKKMFSKINMISGKKDNIVKKVEMHEPSGDKTVLSYTNPELNTNLPDALFNTH